MKKIIITFIALMLCFICLFSQELSLELSKKDSLLLKRLKDSLDNPNSNPNYVIQQGKLLKEKYTDFEENFALYFTIDNYIATSYYYLDQNDNLKLSLDLVQEKHLNAAIQKEKFGEIADYYFLYGEYYYLKSNWKKSLSNYQKAYEFKKLQNPSAPDLKDYLSQLANCYYYTGDYEKSIYYTQQSSDITNDIVYKISAYNNIGKTYKRLKNYNKALDYYRKAINLLHSNPRTLQKEIRRKGTYLLNIGELYSTLEQTDSAFYYLKKAESYLKQDTILIAKIRMESSIVYAQLHQFKRANQSINQAIKFYKAIFRDKHSEIGAAYLKKGEILTKEKKWSQALMATQSAIFNLVIDFNDTLNLSANPILTQVNSKILLLEALSKKADIQRRINLEEDALETISIAANLIDKIRIENLQSNKSKYLLLEKAKSVYGKGIELARLFSNNELAYKFCQKSHSTVLWEMMQNVTANKRGNVPDSLLEKERLLKVAIEEKKSKSIEEQEKLIQLTKKLETDYPLYFQLKSAHQTIELRRIQEELDDEEVLIEYFIGEHNIYAFAISSRDFKVYQQKKSPEFLMHLTQLRQIISKYDGSQESFDSYTTSAQALYDILLKEVLIDYSVKQLIIIPDEELGFLNFGLLLADKLGKKFPRYDKLPYLIKYHDFNYNYSSALFVKLKNIKKKPANLGMLVGFAPVFAGKPVVIRQGEQLNSLIHTLPEVEYIHSLIKGDIYKGEDATAAQFKKSAKEYKIGHLATHASCDDFNPENSKIHFADTSLTCAEIYNLDFNYEMMVLSACETGSGKLQKGEGVISLARAVMSAGCPSVVTSLWQVNDHQTAELMKLFYENISNKQLKHISLGNAQRTYLKEVDVSFAHPYYWGAFVAIGNTDSVSEKNNTWFWWILGSIGLILVVFLVFRASDKKR